MAWEDFATLVLPYDAQLGDRAMWLAMRRSGLGGSDSRVLMGHGYADESEWTVLQSKLLDLPEREDNIRFRRGNHMEAFVAAEFAVETGLVPVRTGMWRSREHLTALANPDWRLEHANGRLTDFGLETKHVDNYGNAKAYRASDEVPPRFYWQCVKYLATTGAPGWWLAIDSPFYSEVEIRFLDREAVLADIDRLLEFEAQWWTSHVVNGFELAGGQRADPEPDPDKTAEAVLPELVLECLARRRELKYPGTKAGKEELARIDELLRTQIGDAQTLTVDGVPVLRWQSRRNPGPPDWPAIEAVAGKKKSELMLPGTESWFLVEASPTKEA